MAQDWWAVIIDHVVGLVALVWLLAGPHPRPPARRPAEPADEQQLERQAWREVP